MKDGRIVARQVRLYVDSGAYSRHSPYGTQKAAAHFPGPYTIPNVQIDCYCVYTNRTPSSAMRGFGVTIADFALEVQMDKLARLVGIDPLEFRFINAYRDGDMKAHHQLTEGAALIECMQEASVWANWPVDPRVLRMSSRERRTG
jgi:CO/xanthine dehydrogenase Mo-binding subunit